MKRILATIITMILCSHGVYASASELDTVREAFVRMSLKDYSPNPEVTENFIKYSDNGRANDVMLLQLYMAVHLPDKEVERLLENFNWEEGCWNDIDYAQKNRGRWPATLHVTRMNSLAKLYKAGNERWKDSPQLKKLLHSCMAWWYANMPVCPNWWHNDIGVPKKFTGVLLMLRDELSQEEIEGGLKVLERSKFGRTGQNKMWLAGNNLMKGLLIDDEDLVIRACDQIKETIYITDGEGVQRDWSFHQHGPQIQFGNYGLAYVEGLSFWMSVLKGTRYDFTQEQKDIVGNLMKEGISWSVYKGFMDPSHCGRQNFINGGRGKAYAFAMAAQNMAQAIDIDREFYEGVSNGNLMPTEYENSLVGERYYWRSDCGIYRRKDWYASIRMHSWRTIGFEFTNRENTLGNFSADGAVILMQDGNEFVDIFGYWDWYKVPGVTAYNDGKPMKSDNKDALKKNHSEHVGGLSYEGIMASTMEINRDGLVALKSAFFFDGCIVNIGSGIKGSKEMFNSVTTSVDQIHLSQEGFKRGENWAWHADRAYLCLDDAVMNVTGDLQRGKWDYIEPSFTDYWDEGKVFKCWFDHPMDEVDAGKADYAYAIFPRTGLKKIRAIAKEWDRKGCTRDLKLLRNDEQCQAVMYGGALCAVFHEPGTYVLDGKTFKISEPEVLIHTENGSESSVLPARSGK